MISWEKMPQNTRITNHIFNDINLILPVCAGLWAAQKQLPDLIKKMKKK